MQSINNELSVVYDDETSQDNGLLYKVGTNGQFANTLSYAAQRANGGEYNMHNFNALME